MRADDILCARQPEGLQALLTHVEDACGTRVSTRPEQSRLHTTNEATHSKGLGCRRAAGDVSLAAICKFKNARMCSFRVQQELCVMLGCSLCWPLAARVTRLNFAILTTRRTASPLCPIHPLQFLSDIILFVSKAASVTVQYGKATKNSTEPRSRPSFTELILHPVRSFRSTRA